jgi:hypothetical protein
MSLRALYLHPKEKCDVSLDAGVALLISAPSRMTATRVPIRHLSRVVSEQSVTWQSEALIACLRFGVPIQFTNRKGEAIGWCLGARRIETTTANLLRTGLESSEWKQKYSDWRENQVRARAAQVLLLCDISPSVMNIKNIRNIACNLHRAKHGAPVGRALRSLTHLHRAEVASALATQIGDPSLIAWHREGLNLIDDFTQITGLHIHVLINNERTLPAFADTQKWATQRYENYTSLWSKSIGDLIGSFEFFLRENWL